MTGGNRSRAQQWAREPLVHFALTGALLFLLYGLVRKDSQAVVDVVAPVRTIQVSAGDLEILRSSFRAAWKREPTGSELGDLVQNFVSEEILFREATALGLDRDDGVVRRRLIEKMAVLARPKNEVAEPSEAELRRWFDLYQHRFHRAAHVSLDQVFFDPKRRGEMKGAQQAAAKARALLSAREADSAVLSTLGDPFVLPVVLADRSEVQLAHQFGEDFVKGVMSAPLARWHGPLRSIHGVHLVRVNRREPARQPSFDEARKHVRADWLTVQVRGVGAAAETLLQRYNVRLDPDARAAVATAPALQRFLAGKK